MIVVIVEVSDPNVTATFTGYVGTQRESST